MAGLTQTLVAELDLSKNKISVCLELGFKNTEMQILPWQEFLQGSRTLSYLYH